MQRHCFTKSVSGKTIVVESPNGTNEKVAWMVAVPLLCPNYMEAFIAEFKTKTVSRKDLITEWRYLKDEKLKGGMPVCTIFEMTDRAKVVIFAHSLSFPLCFSYFFTSLCMTSFFFFSFFSPFFTSFCFLLIFHFISSLPFMLSFL